MGKLLKKFLLILLGLFGLGLVGFVASPRPASLLAKRAFRDGNKTRSKDFLSRAARVDYIRDLTYGSSLEEGYLDLALSKDPKGLPTIFWVYGGAYVGGDKRDVEDYAIELASRGFNVVNINYQLAPGSKYPGPLIQLGEAYNFIRENKDKYGLDLEEVYFAGDSAGAQIAGQFVNIQVNKAYSKLIGLEPVVDSSRIRGVLLFCGIYKIDQVGALDEFFILRFFKKQIGRAYIGGWDWEDSPLVEEASFKNYLSRDFPKTFITDGNISFIDQAKDLEGSLRSLGVYVDSVYYENPNLGHEYQFLLDTREGEETLNRLVDFLNKKE